MMTDPYLQLLFDNQRIQGEYDPSKVSGLTPQWFWERWIDCIDFRGDLQIRSQAITLGRKVSIITASHFIDEGAPGEISYKYVWIEANTYIGSRALLYNCHIGHNAVVACGAVVRNMVVPPFSMVEGNPAKIVKLWDGEEWRKV